MAPRRTIGNVIAVLLACVWTYASQAHFTARITPEVAAGVDGATRTLHQALEFTGLTVDELKHLFGGMGFLTALLLCLPQTRRLGFISAIFVTIAGRIYPQMTIENSEETHLGASFGFMGLAALGAFMRG